MGAGLKRALSSCLGGYARKWHRFSQATIQLTEETSPEEVAEKLYKAVNALLFDKVLTWIQSV